MKNRIHSSSSAIIQKHTFCQEECDKNLSSKYIDNTSRDTDLLIAVVSVSATDNFLSKSFLLGGSKLLSSVILVTHKKSGLKQHNLFCFWPKVLTFRQLILACREVNPM